MGEGGAMGTRPKRSFFAFVCADTPDDGEVDLFCVQGDSESPGSDDALLKRSVPQEARRSPLNRGAVRPDIHL